MKYSIIFCLALTLISSKFEGNLYKSFIQEAKDMLYDDSELCQQHETKDTCTAQKITTSDMECCYIKAKSTYNGTESNQEICQAMPSQIGEIKEIIEFKEAKELIKEVVGYSLVNIEIKEDIPIKIPDDINITANIECKNTEINSGFSLSLTDDDKKALKSESHCFYPLASSIKEDDEIPPSIDDSVKCEKFTLRQDSLNAGIECGYLKAEGKMEGQTVSLKTCFPFNYNLYNKITQLKLMNFLIEKIKETGIQDNVHIEFYNSKGKKVSFDTNNSMLLKSNLLLLLIILFMF